MPCFIANVSHDFRSPLTSIKGYTEALADGTIPAEMQEKYFNIILFETERLTKLTGNKNQIAICIQGFCNWVDDRNHIVVHQSLWMFTYHIWQSR